MPPKGERPWEVYQVRLGRTLRHGLHRSLVPEVENAKRLAGDFLRIRLLGPAGFYLLTDPAAIEHVMVGRHANYIRGEPAWTHLRRGLGNGLVTSDGDFHRRQRRLVGPQFGRDWIPEYARVTAEEAAATAVAWHGRGGEVVAVLDEMMATTARIIVRLLFDIDDPAEAMALSGAVADVNRAATTLDLSLLGLLPFMPTRANRALRRAVWRLEACMIPRIEARLRDPSAHGDLLARLVAAHLEHESDPATVIRQVRDETATLFGAGHETTAGLLAWTWYLLALHPEIEARWHAELDEVLGGRPPVFADIPRLPYTQQILRESMRLYPPVWINGRQAVEEDVVEGRRVTPGMMLWTISYLVHRDPRWFPEPEVFDPERFRPGAGAGRPRFAYFPFGGGPRHCVGSSFAEVEATLILAGLGQRHRLRAMPGWEPELDAMVTLQPRGGLPMRLIRRNGRDGGWA
jgi:cytochrome P450